MTTAIIVSFIHGQLGGATCLLLYFVASSYDVRTGTYGLKLYPNVSTIIVKIAIRDDKWMEGTEAFGVQLILGGYRRPYCLKLGKPSVTTVIIKDGMYTSYMVF